MILAYEDLKNIILTPSIQLSLFDMFNEAEVVKELIEIESEIETVVKSYSRKNQKEYLSNFIKDGRIQLSNNLAEQSVKLFVIGRKNLLFANTPNGAKSSSIIYSIIQTAIENRLKPKQYITYTFKQIQQGNDVTRYVSWSEEIPDYCRLKNLKQK